MDIHRDVSDIVNDLVLRDVVQIHGMDIPYPAELWVGGKSEHKHGTTMFNIGDRRFLTAEYFGYDSAWNPLESLRMVFNQLDAKVPSLERVPRLHGDEAVADVPLLAEPRRPSLLPDAGHQDQNGVGAARIVVLRYGSQPVVERPAPQGETLAHHAEVAAVVKGDGGVEAAPAVELHVRT